MVGVGIHSGFVALLGCGTGSTLEVLGNVSEVNLSKTGMGRAASCLRNPVKKIPLVNKMCSYLMKMVHELLYII